MGNRTVAASSWTKRPESPELNIRFPGQYYDAETGLHYNRFRYYDPEIGRYVSADSIGQRGGVNLYAYARNSPSWGIDALGLYTLSVGGFVSGGSGVHAQGQKTLVVDTQGNVGVATTSTLGGQVGATPTGAAGIVVGATDSPNLYGLEGRSATWGGSMSGPLPGTAAGVDFSGFVAGPNQTEGNYGMELQLGAGGGAAEAHVGISNTTVDHLFNLGDVAAWLGYLLGLSDPLANPDECNE